MPTTPAAANLQSLLEQRTSAGELYERLPDQALRCVACGHRCFLPDGKIGICKVRFNRGGTLQVPTGYVAALQCDPVEKKPFFHARPGALALSFGMLGCDYHCGYCQNWLTSQALRDPAAGTAPRRMTPEQIVRLALDYGAEIVASTYNEPLITSEWAVEVFKVARAHGLLTAYISNGNATPEVLDYLRPWVDLYKVDLKGFNDKQYRKLGGVLATVLDTIRRLVAMDFWLEVVTLIVPGFNDSDSELSALAGFLASVSRDIPWHVTAYHPDYKMIDRDRTTADTLLRAVAIGRSAGLRFVYAGNLPGHVGRFEDTRCPACDTTVVERTGFRVQRVLLGDGRCPRCASEIPGRWGTRERTIESPGYPVAIV
ncbi:MAG: AmmeMemoRadiSam system radical SAM enzyme [Deltaproteobacteria bacterium]|nr:AmmeMemoRadiSam system radical SAM enzyme [Deltaproteobacteria bacterium]MBI3390930.1 AmmeMemoRadiSam system radical SAM enzyme [Deltaproteobacteria bacterium]